MSIMVSTIVTKTTKVAPKLFMSSWRSEEWNNIGVLPNKLEL